MNTAFWYASRATGIVALLLLTAVLVLGILVNRQGRLPGLPRFAVTDLHRNLSLLSVAFIVVHVLTAVLDTYVHIPLVSAVVPFASGYERLWLALGAVSLGHHARDDRDQPAPRPPEPDPVAGRPPARLRELAGRVRAQHRLEQGPAAGLDARPGRRLRDDRRGGGNLAAGSRRPAGAQGPAGRRDLRAARRPGDRPR